MFVRLLSLAAAVAFVVTPATSQTSFVIPSGLGLDKNPGSRYLSAGLAAYPTNTGKFSRAQVVYAKSALGFTKGTITKLELRRDAVNGNFGAVTRKFTVRLGYTSHDPKSLPFSFGKVLSSSSASIVLSGNVNLPKADYQGRTAHAWSIAFAASAPWAFDATKGNLVIGYDSDGTTVSPWGADAHHTLGDAKVGSIRSLAAGCAGSNKIKLRTLNDVSQVVTGQTIQSLVIGLPRTVRFAMFNLGFGPNRVIDLTSVGAPGCMGVVSPFCANGYPAFFEGGQNYNCAVAEIPVPDNPFLIGAKFWGQWAAADPQANALGIITSDADEYTLGTGSTMAYRVMVNTNAWPGLDVAFHTGHEFGPIFRVTGNLQ